MRKARHELALAQAEVHQAKQEGGQLKQALEDQRRENQILTEEVHQQNSKLGALTSERAGLEGDLEGNKAVLEQVQTSQTAQTSHGIAAAATVAGVAKQRHRVKGETTARCHRAQSDGEVCFVFCTGALFNCYFLGMLKRRPH